MVKSIALTALMLIGSLTAHADEPSADELTRFVHHYTCHEAFDHFLEIEEYDFTLLPVSDINFLENQSTFHLVQTIEVIANNRDYDFRPLRTSVHVRYELDDRNSYRSRVLDDITRCMVD